MSRTFNELIKEFNRIRSYARDFYINGFKQREDFTEKSLRSYDNERRRIESYLGPYIEEEYSQKGKAIRLNLKQNPREANPFFKLWQTKSFTKNDIFLHFVILDCLTSHPALSLPEIMRLIDQDYLSYFDEPPLLSEITLRNKLKEYQQLGILLEISKEQRLYYELASPLALSASAVNALHFFKEVFPVGIVGQYLLDSLPESADSPFIFKHHFIMHSLDEAIVLTVLTAINERRFLTVQHYNGSESTLTPLSLYISTETGRQYLVGILPNQLILSIRIDQIKEATIGTPITNYLILEDHFLKKKQTTWNGNFSQKKRHSLRVLLTIQEGKEDYLMARIEREQRMGKCYRLDSERVVFEIELTDLLAINPFLRTFIGRILSIESSDKLWQANFIRDLKQLITLYYPTEEATFDD